MPGPSSRRTRVHSWSGLLVQAMSNMEADAFATSALI